MKIKTPGCTFLCKHSVTGASDYGGVGMFICNTTLNHKHKPSLCFDSDGSETEFIEIETKKHEKSIIVGVRVVYRYLKTLVQDYAIFCSHLEKLLENTAKKHKIMLCGDINLDTGAAVLQRAVKESQNLLHSFGCHNIINQYTRIETNVNGVISKSTIDHIITNIKSDRLTCGVIQFKIADHLPIFGMFDLAAERQRLQTERCIYSSFGKTRFLELIKQYTDNMVVEFVNNIPDPDTTLEDLVKVIKVFEDRAFPLQKLSRKKLRFLEKHG